MRFAFCLFEGNRRLNCFWFSNMNHTWFLDRFWVTLDRNYSLIVLCQFCSFSSRRLTLASSVENIKHLKSSAVTSACLKSLQSLFPAAANVRKSCWLSLTVFRHFQRLWNKVVLGPNSSDRSLIVSEISKSVVFLGNMKSRNLLGSVVPSYLNSRSTLFSLGHCSLSTLKISS